MEMRLRGEIHAVQLKTTDVEARAWHNSGISGHGLTRQAGHGLSNIKEEYGEEVQHKVLEDVLRARYQISYYYLYSGLVLLI
jgi:hypothetical protein